MDNESVDFGFCAGLCDIREILTHATKIIDKVPLCDKCARLYNTQIKPMLDNASR